MRLKWKYETNIIIIKIYSLKIRLLVEGHAIKLEEIV